MACRRRRYDAGICGQRHPYFYPSQPGSVPGAPRACPLASSQPAAVAVQTLGMLPARKSSSALPLDHIENKQEGSHNPLLTCSWLRPQVRAELGGQIRASTSTVSPRACTSGLNGEFCFSTRFTDHSTSWPRLSTPPPKFLPQTWGCLVGRAEDSAAHGYYTWDEAKLGCGHTKVALLGLLCPVSLWRGENESWPYQATSSTSSVLLNYLGGQPCHWPVAPR